MDDGFEMERYFKQDLVTKQVTSFSLGNTWFYFFRETCIGFRDLETEEAAFLDVKNHPLENDNYTSQHMITEQIVKQAIDEGNSQTEPQLLGRVELANTMYKAAFQVLQRFFDKSLIGKV